jgi:hypothetical protein
MKWGEQGPNGTRSETAVLGRRSWPAERGGNGRDGCRRRGYGGTITAESDGEGKGATFRVKLPN